MSLLLPSHVSSAPWFVIFCPRSHQGPGGRAAPVLNADAMSSKVLAQDITCLQQGLPLQALLLLGLPGGLSCGQGKLPDLDPEPNQLLHHTVQSG